MTCLAWVPDPRQYLAVLRFERDGQTWKSVSCEMATFVPLRKGVCADIYTLVSVAEGKVRV
ncbi:hypothetical protein AB0K05_26990 [Nonomuraea sp. NPDC049486]|uniref:hypothetical protein n=1 Tax=Nonomuraea sp. NPDC049486 TaxID=3155773 RepID=UPI0034272392